jgi:hypothetical protein
MDMARLMKSWRDSTSLMDRREEQSYLMDRTNLLDRE